MGDTTDIDDKMGRAHQSGADHYRTADMHRASALAALTNPYRGDDPAEAEDHAALVDKRFERHLRLAEVHARLAQVRIGAVQMLRQHTLTQDGNVTPRQRVAVEAELQAWADTIAPSPL